MEAIEIKRLEELAIRAARSGRTQFTKFLEPAAMTFVRAAANKAGAQAAFFGGYPDAERVVAAFYADEPPEEWEYPICPMRISWNAKYADPGHRDLLGALMGLGIERDTTGDIAMGDFRDDPCACLFALPEVADYISANLDSAGRASVKVSSCEMGDIAIRPPEGSFIRVTVQNPRLDAVVAAGYRLSRSEAQKYIAQGLVKLNHVPCEKSDARISEGDLISARGLGRLKVQEEQGETRKGRQGMLLFKYGK